MSQRRWRRPWRKATTLNSRSCATHFNQSCPPERRQKLTLGNGALGSGEQAVRLGAIVVIGDEDEILPQKTVGRTPPAGPETGATLGEPLGCIDVIGCSAAERMIERFLNAEVEIVSVLMDARKSCPIPRFRSSSRKVTVQVVTDVASSLTEKLRDYSQSGIEHSFIASADLYAETDLLDLFYFHR